MTYSDARPLDELEAIDRKQAWIALKSVLALLFLVGVLFEAPPAFVVLTVVVAVSVKKAARQYRALERRRADLLHALGSRQDPSA